MTKFRKTLAVTGATHDEPARCGGLRMVTLAAVSCALTPLLAGAAHADGPYEPNNSPSTASGPLTGGADYHAAIENDDDHDFYAMYLGGSRQITVSFIETGGPGCPSNYSSYRILAHVENERGKFAASGVRVVANVRTTSFTTPPEGGKFFVVLEPSPNFMREPCSYSFRVEPSDAVLPSLPVPAPPPPPVSAPPVPAPPPVDTSPAVRQARGFSLGLKKRNGRRYPVAFYTRFTWTKDIKWQRTTIRHNGRKIRSSTWTNVPPIAGNLRAVE